LTKNEGEYLIIGFLRFYSFIRMIATKMNSQGKTSSRAVTNAIQVIETQTIFL